MSDELKPCAHCGESAELCCPSGLSWWARCSNTQCGMATKIAYSPDPVVSAWNRRADAALAKREAVPDGLVRVIREWQTGAIGSNEAMIEITMIAYQRSNEEGK